MDIINIMSRWTDAALSKPRDIYRIAVSLVVLPAAMGAITSHLSPLSSLRVILTSLGIPSLWVHSIASWWHATQERSALLGVVGATLAFLGMAAIAASCGIADNAYSTTILGWAIATESSFNFGWKYWLPAALLAALLFIANAGGVSDIFFIFLSLVGYVGYAILLPLMWLLTSEDSRLWSGRPSEADSGLHKELDRSPIGNGVVRLENVEDGQAS